MESSERVERDNERDVCLYALRWYYVAPCCSRNHLNGTAMALVFWTSCAMGYNGLRTGYDGNNIEHVVIFYVGILVFLPLVCVLSIYRCQCLANDRAHHSTVSASVAVLEVWTSLHRHNHTRTTRTHTHTTRAHKHT